MAGGLAVSSASQLAIARFFTSPRKQGYPQMLHRPHYPAAFRPTDNLAPGELIPKECQWAERSPPLPPVDLAGVPTISDSLDHAIKSQRPPTYKQRQHNSNNIRRACEEIRRRRGTLTLN